MSFISVQSLSHVWLFATPWTASWQSSLSITNFPVHHQHHHQLSHAWLFVTPRTIQSMEFFRPDYWSGQPFPFSRGSSQPRDQTEDRGYITRLGFGQHPDLISTGMSCVTAYLEFWLGRGFPGGSSAPWVRLLPTELMHACVLSCFSHVWLCVTPWTIAFQDPLSMGFPRQEYWNGLPCPPLGDLPEPGI